MKELWEKLKRKDALYPILCGIVFVLLLVIDLVSKAWAANAAGGVEGTLLFTLIPHLIYFRYAENTGTAFGMWDDNPTMMAVVTVITVLMIAAVVVLFFTFFKNNRPIRMALAVIEAGAIGNLIDRLFLGYVRDFVDVSAFGFGICNIADFCVTFGAAVLIFCLLFIGKDALFPLKKKWREEAKAQELRKEQEKEGGGKEPPVSSDGAQAEEEPRSREDGKGDHE